MLTQGTTQKMNCTFRKAALEKQASAAELHVRRNSCHNLNSASLASLPSCLRLCQSFFFSLPPSTSINNPKSKIIFVLY